MSSDIDMGLIELRIEEAEILAKINKDNKADLKTVEKYYNELYVSRYKLLEKIFSKLPKLPVKGSLAIKDEFDIVSLHYEYHRRYFEMLTKHPCYYTYKYPKVKISVDADIERYKTSKSKLYDYLKLLVSMKN